MSYPKVITLEVSPSRSTLSFDVHEPSKVVLETQPGTNYSFSRIGQGTNAISIFFASCKHGDRCLKVTHTRTIHFHTGMRRRELGTSIPERLRGQPCGVRWKLARALDASAGPVSYNWYSALEPASYGLERDHESYGLTWCGDRRCVNYHGYLRERGVRGQRLSAKCGYNGCEEVRRFYRWPGSGSGFPVTMKRDGTFGVLGGGVWADEEWADAAPPPVVEDPASCVIL